MVTEIQKEFDLDHVGEGKLEQDFWKFHRKHPEIYRALVYFARQWRERKGSNSVVGIKALYERVRWELSFESLSDQDSPKLSNNHTAFYARLIMEREDDLIGIFKTKTQKIPSTIRPKTLYELYTSKERY